MAGVLTKAERVQIITTMTSKEFSPAITWYERALVCYELTVQHYEQCLQVYEAQEGTHAEEKGGLPAKLLLTQLSALTGQVPWKERDEEDKPHRPKPAVYSMNRERAKARHRRQMEKKKG
jgi:hypothetical protein